MNSRNLGKIVLPKWSVLLVLLTVTAFASAQNKQKSAPAPAPHASAPSHAAAPSRPAPSAPHAAPQHPGGNAQRPGAPGGASNRGPSGQANRPGAAGANRGPGGANTNSRGPGGANASRSGAAGANNRGPGGANANNRGPMGGNKAGQAGGNRPGQAGGNRPGQTAGNRPGNAGANANRRQPAGSKTVALKNGGNASFRKNGQVRSIHTKGGMTINHGVRGGRHIESVHNGRRVVSLGRHGGYSQRAYYNHGGRTYVSRTYYSGGHYYAYGYRSYSYGGYPYYGYAPAYYYGPAYYGWAYNPWPAPVSYGWGWGGAPWYGYYGSYFQPYPVYPTAAFWLTDYLISANLQAAYAAQQATGDEANDQNGRLEPEQPSTDEIASLWTTDPLIAANLETTYGVYMLGAAAPAAKGGATQLSPEVKQAIADEVKKEIAAEKDAATGAQKAASGEEVPAALDPNIRYFVVSSDVDATTSDGVECGLTPGDVIYRTGDQPDDDHMVDATVKSSKKDDCAIGVTIGVDVGDLQEMHNQLRIQMDAGLKELADKQGKNGLPAAPDTKTQAGEVPPPSPDTNVSNDLQQQKKEADEAEAEAKQSQ